MDLIGLYDWGIGLGLKTMDHSMNAVAVRSNFDKNWCVQTFTKSVIEHGFQGRRRDDPPPWGDGGRRARLTNGSLNDKL